MRAMAGTGGQAEIPCQNIPGDAAEHRAKDGGGGDELGINQIRADGFGHGHTGKRADEIGHGAHDDGLARGQDPSADDGGDGIGRVMETVGEGKNQHDDDDQQKEEHRSMTRSGMLQHHIGHDIAGVPAPVHRLFPAIRKGPWP